MKPGGIVNLNKLNSFAIFRKNKLFIFLCFAFIIGIVIGTLSLFTHSRASDYAGSIFSEYINSRQELSFFSVFFTEFLKYLTVCFAFFIFGTSVIGVIISPILCCLLGTYYGIISSFAYSNFTLKGIAFNAVILIPPAIFFAVCAFFSAKEAFNFSASMIKLVLPKSRPMNLSGEFKLYCGRFIIIIGLLLLSAVVDAAVSSSFLKHFSF